jgi:uncharacterized protein
MITKVVLDTNVVVSANLKAAGLEAVVLSLAANRKIQMYVSPAIQAEYEKVLRRPKFRITPERTGAVLQLLRDVSLLLTELPTVMKSRHEEDNRFLECAQAAHYPHRRAVRKHGIAFARDGFDQRRLARPVRPRFGHLLAHGDLQRDDVHRDPALARDGDVVEFDQWTGHVEALPASRIQ